MHQLNFCYTWCIAQHPEFGAEILEYSDKNTQLQMHKLFAKSIRSFMFIINASTELLLLLLYTAAPNAVVNELSSCLP